MIMSTLLTHNIMAMIIVTVIIIMIIMANICVNIIPILLPLHKRLDPGFITDISQARKVIRDCITVWMKVWEIFDQNTSGKLPLTRMTSALIVTSVHLED